MNGSLPWDRPLLRACPVIDATRLKFAYVVGKESGSHEERNVA